MARFEKTEVITRTLIIPDATVGRISFPTNDTARVVLEYETGNEGVEVPLSSLPKGMAALLAECLDTLRKLARDTRGFEPKEAVAAAQGAQPLKAGSR
jgi:hypothetical protein